MYAEIHFALKRTKTHLKKETLIISFLMLRPRHLSLQGNLVDCSPAAGDTVGLLLSNNTDTNAKDFRKKMQQIFHRSYIDTPPAFLFAFPSIILVT